MEKQVSTWTSAETDETSAHAEHAALSALLFETARRVAKHITDAGQPAPEWMRDEQLDVAAFHSLLSRFCRVVDSQLALAAANAPGAGDCASVQSRAGGCVDELRSLVCRADQLVRQPLVVRIRAGRLLQRALTTRPCAHDSSQASLPSEGGDEDGDDDDACAQVAAWIASTRQALRSTDELLCRIQQCPPQVLSNVDGLDERLADLSSQLHRQYVLIKGMQAVVEQDDDELLTGYSKQADTPLSSDGALTPSQEDDTQADGTDATQSSDAATDLTQPDVPAAAADDDDDHQDEASKSSAGQSSADGDQAPPPPPPPQPKRRFARLRAAIAKWNLAKWRQRLLRRS